MGSVNRDFDVQPVVAKQHGLGSGGVTTVASEDAGPGQADRAAGHVRSEGAALDPVGEDVSMRTAGQRHCLVQEIPRPGDDLLAAGRVVSTGPGRAFLLRNGVGAVEGVVQAAPARVGGIEGVARVGHRHDELGSRDLRDLVVDMRRLDAEVGPLGHEIADVGEKATVLVGIDGLAAAGAVPRVDLGLQRPATGKEVAVHGREVVEESVEFLPEGVAREVKSRQNLILDKGVQLDRDLALSDSHSFDHGTDAPN